MVYRSQGLKPPHAPCKPQRSEGQRASRPSRENKLQDGSRTPLRLSRTRPGDELMQLPQFCSWRHGTAMHAARAASRGEARACFEPPGSSNRRLLSRELAGPFIYSSPWPPRQAAIWRREQRQGKPGKARRGLGGIGSGGPCTVLYIWSNSFPSDLPGPAEVTNRASASKPCFLQVRVPLIDLPNLVELPRGGLGGIPMQL